MSLRFHTDESFREAFRYRSTDAGVLRFPFPFPDDRYMYAVNLEPHTRGGPTAAYDAVFDVDEHYIVECRERALVLARDPKRCQTLPHMIEAELDTLELLMESLSSDYPVHFHLERHGDRWTWTNRPLGLVDNFIFGDASSLPLPPFEYITRQSQGDFTLQDQRDSNLWMDGGMVTTQADWSLDVDLGMSFNQWHGPVPKAHELGVFDRALKYLLALRAGRPVRRLNWTMTVNPRLDTSPEEYPRWGPDRLTITPENVGERLFLCVELQTLFRLPRSNAILFGIRCYLLRLSDIVRVRKWACRLHRVLRDLDSAVAAYKGITRYRDVAVAWLASFDEAAPTSAGTAPDQGAL